LHSEHSAAKEVFDAHAMARWMVHLKRQIPVAHFQSVAGAARDRLLPPEELATRFCRRDSTFHFFLSALGAVFSDNWVDYGFGARRALYPAQWIP
jgi:hypothetical protein